MNMIRFYMRKKKHQPRGGADAFLW